MMRVASKVVSVRQRKADAFAFITEAQSTV